MVDTQSNNILPMPVAKYFSTVDINEPIWESYVGCFNLVFGKSYEKSYFIQKYRTAILGHSFHGFLIDEFNRVYGGVTIIPFTYFFGNVQKLIGLAVDAFVHPDFRTNAFALEEMYSVAFTEATNAKLYGVISVPNNIAYPYWKEFVGWKDIGELPYYALPLRLEKFSNIPFPLASMANSLLVFGARLTTFFCYPRHRKINLLKDPTFFEHRLYDWHQVIQDEESLIVLRTSDEESIKTTYLLGCFDLRMNWSSKSFRKALKFIVTNIKPDIILFIGNLPFIQFSLFKVPQKRVPKALTLTIDLIENNTVLESECYNLNNWDFSLINYDVR